MQAIGIVALDDLPPKVAGYLQAAGAAKHWREAEDLLWRAQACDPACLHVYYTLYKLYFRYHRLSDAGRVVCLALDAAAQAAHISADWSALDRHSADWQVVDSAQHFYLFSLKALAFIRLRQLRADEAKVILAKLHEIDPEDSVGASVIAAYATGATA